MKKTKGKKTGSFETVGLAYSSAPKTHVFYESEGERSIDPLLMVKNGITLWLEQISIIDERDLSHLWAFAKNLLAVRGPGDEYSYVEKLRQDITVGTIIPEKWDRRRAYPYKGLLISAVYFQEAKRLCEEGDADRAWHIVTIAYYQLGLNTSPSLTQTVSKAATIKHASENIFKRDFVLTALARVRSNGTAKSIPQAIDEIYELIAYSKGATKLLDDIEAQSSNRPTSADADDAAERLRQTMKNWARANGPYPEIWEAFSYFDKAVPRSESASPDHEDLSWGPVPENSVHYMRFVSYLESGFISTLEIQGEPEEEIEAQQAE